MQAHASDELKFSTEETHCHCAEEIKQNEVIHTSVYGFVCTVYIIHFIFSCKNTCYTAALALNSAT